MTSTEVREHSERAQAEYALKRRVRAGYLDGHVRDRFEDRGLRLLDNGHLQCTVAWMPPLIMKSQGAWNEYSPELAGSMAHKTMTYTLRCKGLAYYVTCEGYLVDKWWKEDPRDISNMGR